MNGPSNRSIVAASIIVFVIAILLRVPSCYESFWVDELHSAWCVWGGLDDVAQRAELGHQSPIYFIGLWFWKQIVGGSEVALRLSSVLAVAASCVVLTIGIAKWSGSLVAGIASGLILAIENNSIFFGTELRPFAFVIFFASIATLGFAQLATLHSRHDDRRCWIGMTAAILLAALCQPTSLGILILLPFVLCCIWMIRDPRQLLRITLSDGLMLIAATATAFALWSITLRDSFGQRRTWAAFAAASSIDEIWDQWSWVPLWCLPVLLLIAAQVVGRRQRDPQLRSTWLLAMIAVTGTFGYWLVSWMEWFPLWHRRYFVAVLPILAFVVGGGVAAVARIDSLHRLAAPIAVCLIAATAYQQSLFESLRRYPVALVRRGEDWRAAIEWVRSESNPRDSIYLESGLIEWNRSMRTDEQQVSYFLFPVSGPYQLEQPAAVINPDLELPYHDLYDDTKGIFLVVRRPKSRIPINPTKWGWVYGNRYLEEIKSFGNLTVISMPTLEQDPSP